MTLVNYLNATCVVVCWISLGVVGAGYWFTHWQVTIARRDGADYAERAEERHCMCALLLAVVGGWLTFMALLLATYSGRVQLHKCWRAARFYHLY